MLSMKRIKIYLDVTSRLSLFFFVTGTGGSSFNIVLQLKLTLPKKKEFPL